MTKQLINPPQLLPPRGFNHGILCQSGQVLFLAGQDASDENGRIVRRAAQVAAGDRLAVQVAGGTFGVQVD